MRKLRLSPEFSAVVAESISELEPFLHDLQELASSALEPNVFYEPWMLVPAMRWLASTSVQLHLVLIFADTASASPPRQLLSGFFPVKVRRSYNHFPVRTARLWRHKHSHLAVPLLRRDNAHAALDAFFKWAATDCRCHVLEFGEVSGEGLFHQLMIDWLANNSRANLVDVRYVRPQLNRAQSAEGYFSLTVSKRHQKDLEKKERKLRQFGPLEYVHAASLEEAQHLIDTFIALEASGWKGKQGVALASVPAEAGFFREAMSNAWRLGRLEVLGLRLGENIIALKVNLPCPGGSFAYMITFDEAYSVYSPGLLLEIENVRRIHADTRVAWMDSCADSRSPIFNRVWAEKRVIETLLVSNNSCLGDFWIAVIPFGHWLRQVFEYAIGKFRAIKLTPTPLSNLSSQKSSSRRQTCRRETTNELQQS